MIAESHTKHIAQTILNQIKYADKMFLLAVGATNYTILSESKQFQGGVKFQCNGLQHKGSVVVQLKWIDVYTITFIDTTGSIVKIVDDVYCDGLVPVLDYVEGR